MDCSAQAPFARADATDNHLLAGHEAQQPNQDRRHLPRRIDARGMEVQDCQTQSGRSLQTPGGHDHADRRGYEGVFEGEDEGAPVLTSLVRRGWWALK